MQDDVGDLPVQSLEGWIEAPALPGAYIVNLGVMIARWTNHRYRSTRHRVINRFGRECYCAPFFYTNNPGNQVSCISTCLAPGDV